MNIKKRFKAKAKQAWVRSELRVHDRTWQQAQEIMSNWGFIFLTGP